MVSTNSRQATNLWTNLWRTRPKPADAAGEFVENYPPPTTPPTSSFPPHEKWVDHQRASATFRSCDDNGDPHYTTLDGGAASKPISLVRTAARRGRAVLTSSSASKRDGSVYLRTLQRGCCFFLNIFIFAISVFRQVKSKREREKPVCHQPGRFCWPMPLVFRGRFYGI